MILYEKVSRSGGLSPDDLREAVISALEKLGPVRKMLVVPPDITRLQSRAGELTRYIYEYIPKSVNVIIPALGTHIPMTDREIEMMFGNVPTRLFRIHRWRTDCKLLGAIPSDFVKSISKGKVNYQIPIYVNRILFEQKYDCILSISQVVPHEVAGMAGYNKNIVIGLGGSENIHKSHFLGAVYGMEKIMGRTDSPVRKVLDYANEKFLCDLPIVHVITVIGTDNEGSLIVKGLFIGDDNQCYFHAAQLSRRINIHSLDKPLKKIVVFLNQVEYKSTWLGNKSIYRTRMAVADRGELIVIAPAVKMFGEDPEIDRLIRQFGYKGTSAIIRAVNENDLLKNNLCAAAHLIHGSSEGRFSVTYCAGGLNRSDIENTGFRFAQVKEVLKRYNPKTLSEGYNRLKDGEEIFFISNPATGLWATKGNF